MPSPTIRVALPSFRVDTDTNPDHFALYGDQDWVLIKEKLHSTLVIGASGNAIITHNLGYVPLVFVFGKAANLQKLHLLEGDSGSAPGSIELNSTQLRIWNNSGNQSLVVEYYIFYDKIVAPNLMQKSMRYVISGQSIDRHPVLAVAKQGINARKTDNPNDFIYHSDYNTFKIIATGLYEPTIPHDTPITEYPLAHGRPYAPYALAFMREGSTSEVVMATNETDNIGSYLKFEGVAADQTNLIFKISNSHFSNDIVAHIRWFIVQ